MSKELTVFILDASKSMGHTSPEETKSDFQRALRYTFGYFIQHLVKNRKSDRFALILFSGGSIDVFYENSPLTLSKVRTYYTHSVKFHKEDRGEVEKYSLVDALCKAFELFSRNIHLKFTRNLYLFTNGLLSVRDSQKVLVFKEMLVSNQINTLLVLFSNRENQTTEAILGYLTQQLKNTKKIDFDELVNSGPPLKLIATRCISEATLGLGIVEDMMDGIGNAIQFHVQAFPGVKVQNQIHGNSYYLVPDLDDVVKVETSVLHYIKKTSGFDDEDEEEEEDAVTKETDSQSKLEKEKISVNKSDCIPGFKYSHRDVLAISSELEEATTLETSPILSILGFYEKDKFPFAYFTDECTYIVPHLQYHEHNRLGYSSLVKSMIDLNYLALVRFVAKENTEVQICVAFPRQVTLGKQQGNILVLSRVAMKEDEKIGHFPKLEEAKDKTVDDLMEQFIKSKKLRSDSHFDPNTLDNLKIGLTQSEPGSAPITEKTSIDDILLSMNPATKRFNYYLEKILFESLMLTNPLGEFLQEEKFVERYLSAGEKDVLFNLDSILDSHSDFLFTDAHQHASDISLKLQAKLDVKYKLQANLEKKKRSYKTAFAAQPNDGKFDEYFDIEDLLAG